MNAFDDFDDLSLANVEHERREAGLRSAHQSPRYDIGALIEAIVEQRPYSLWPDDRPN